MKVLTLNWTYEYGSTGKMICDIEKQLPQCEFFHCYEYKTQGTAPNAYCLTNWFWSHVYNRTSKLKGLQYENGKQPTKKFIQKIKEYKPDVVHIHCPNGNTLNLYAILNYLKTNRIPTVITNHAEFFYTGNCPHAFDCTQYLSGCKSCPRYKTATKSLIFNRAAESWEKMRDAFEQFTTLEMICVSKWQAKRLEGSTICRDIPYQIIPNGLDVETFHAYPEIKKETDTKVLLHVTANFSDDPQDSKGGSYLIALARILEERKCNVQIQVVGKTTIKAPDKIPANMKFMGEVLNQKELAQLYAKANLMVMTSLRETFGMSCAESLCCGTPVVGFENGGSESIAIPEYSQFVKTGDVEQLADVVEDWMNRESQMAISKEAVRLYSKERMAQRYYKVYCDLLERCKGKEVHDGCKND